MDAAESERDRRALEKCRTGLCREMRIGLTMAFSIHESRIVARGWCCQTGSNCRPPIAHWGALLGCPGFGIRERVEPGAQAGLQEGFVTDL